MESSAVAAGHKSGSVGETSYSYGRLLSRPTTKRRSGIVWEASLFVRTAPEPSDDEPQVPAVSWNTLTRKLWKTFLNFNQ